MSVSFTLNQSDSVAYIRIQGRFEFSLHNAFRDAYKDLKNCKTVVVDLSLVDYMDSAALGMLLLLREYALGKGVKTKLLRPNANVSRVLEIANFSRLFEIEK